MLIAFFEGVLEIIPECRPCFSYRDRNCNDHVPYSFHCFNDFVIHHTAFSLGDRLHVLIVLAFCLVCLR